MFRGLPYIVLVVLAACSSTGNGGADNGGDGGNDGGGTNSNDGGGTNSNDGGGTSGNDGGGTNSNDGGGTITPDWVSGTRLRARVQTSADGAKAFYGWYDSQLHVNCNPAVAGDGQERCLPATQINITDSFYADTGCTIRLGWSLLTYTGACSTTLGLRQEQTSVCGEYGLPTFQTHLYAVTTFAGTVYSKSGTSCTANTNTTQYPYTTYAFYQVGAEQPPTTYAAITITTE